MESARLMSPRRMCPWRCLVVALEKQHLLRGVLPCPGLFGRSSPLPIPVNPPPAGTPPPGLGLRTRPPSALTHQRPHRLSGGSSPSARGKRYKSRASPPPPGRPLTVAWGAGGRTEGGWRDRPPPCQSHVVRGSRTNFWPIFAQGEEPKPPLGGHLLVPVFRGALRPRENWPGVGGRGNPLVQQ